MQQYNLYSSSDDISEYETDNESDNRNQTMQSVSLGQMIPTHQRTTTVQTDYIRSHHVIIHSRDRNLLDEHLFGFRVVFGTTAQHCSYDSFDTCFETMNNKKKNNICNIKVDTSTPSSQTCEELRRRCTIEQAFTEVQSLHLTDVLLPHASFLQSITHPLDATKSITLSIPPEIYIRLTPDNGESLYGTNNTTNTCHFVCSQVATSTTHSRYRTLHSEFQHDTPVNFLHNIMFHLHQEQERLVIHPFSPENSPDIHMFKNISWQFATSTLTFQIQNIVKTNYIKEGHLVSFRDIQFIKKVNTMDKHEKALYDVLCILKKHTCIVIQVNPDTKKIVVDVSTVGLPLETLSIDTSLDTQIDTSILLNESMQYSFMLRFNCVEKRLKQSLDM